MDTPSAESMIILFILCINRMTDSGNAVNLGPQPSTVFANLGQVSYTVTATSGNRCSASLTAVIERQLQ
jgi:hypothetical protein